MKLLIVIALCVASAVACAGAKDEKATSVTDAVKAEVMDAKKTVSDKTAMAKEKAEQMAAKAEKPFKHKTEAVKTQVPASFNPKGGYEEGKHYSVIRGAKKPVFNGSVKVTEMFWYGCGHCYSFESVLKPWKAVKPDFIKFEQSPAMWRQRRPGVPGDLMWTHAKLFYAASAIGGLDKLHSVFFDAMHKEKKLLINPGEIQAVVTSAGLDGKNFTEVMDSFAVNSQVQQADSRQRAYKISATPEIVVADYYLVSASKAGSQKEMLNVVDFLAAKIKAGK